MPRCPLALLLALACLLAPAVADAQPTASYTYQPAAPVVGQPVTFDASASVCDVPRCTYRWVDLRDDNTSAAPNTSLGRGRVLTVTFQSAGMKNVQLRVRNRRGESASTKKAITVSSAAASPPAESLPGWRALFADNFDTPVALGSFPAAVQDRWDAYPAPWRDTTGNGTYWPEKTISVHDGSMDIYVHSETISGRSTPLVAAPLPVLPSSDPAVTTYSQYGRTWTAQRYGRYAVRFRADPVAGYKTAWLLWPTSDIWPRDGEIDFPEGDLNGMICAFMHRQNGTSGSDQDGACTSSTYTSWHTAIVEWTPLVCKFLLDGQVILQATVRIPSTPMRWVLQTETRLSGGAPPSSARAHVLVDWVAMWAPA